MVLHLLHLQQVGSLLLLQLCMVGFLHRHLPGRQRTISIFIVIVIGLFFCTWCVVLGDLLGRLCECQFGFLRQFRVRSKFAFCNQEGSFR